MIRLASIRSLSRLVGACTVACAGTAVASLVLCADASAQANVQWVKFKDAPTRLGVLPTDITSSDTEVDFATGDLDKDGWVDVVAVRKEQSSTTGKRPNILLMNNHGKLENKTLQYAAASDVPGDLGFRTPTNDRDVKIIDVNGDTWLDVVTCTTLSDGDVKAISHPRVYINLQNDGLGHWLGLRNEDARIPQLLTIPGNLAVAPRFCEVAAGDVTGDGAPDLYFVDYDSTETGIGEDVNADLNDRLLVNDGNGFFTDSNETRLNAAELQSAFGVKAEILELNDVPGNDIVKLSTLGSPQAVLAMYQQPVGSFTLLTQTNIGSGSPYGFDMGNLNGDGLPDIANADDGADVYRLATGIDALHRVTYGPLKNYEFVAGGDGEFGHNVYIRDLDGDGLGDVLISSVDVDFTGCSGRLHIYHNRGGTIGGDVTLREEAEIADSEFGSGWKGVVGITANDMVGSYDMAFEDFDHDGDLDMLIGVCGGTHYWKNLTAADTCQTDLGFGGPGAAVLSICGEDLTLNQSSATLALTGAAPSSPLFIAVGLNNNPTPLKGGTLVPVPLLLLLPGFNTNGLGGFTVPVPGNSGAPFDYYVQIIVKSGPVYEFSNALKVHRGQ